MWEWDVTRDGRAAAGKGNVGGRGETGLLSLPLDGETYSQSLGQHPAPIELVDLGIVVCCRDGCFARMSCVEKRRNVRV